ncbi:MAG: hypothetical protein ACJ76Y_17670 [Thermoanaerobaculia bacterium]
MLRHEQFWLTVLGCFIVLGGMTTNTVGAAQQCQLRQDNFGESRQTKRHCQGKNCSGVNTPWDCGTTDVEITPSPVHGKVGTPVEIRIDATSACNGQSVKDFKGSIKWEAGSTCDLSDSWGYVSHTYRTGGSYMIEIEMTYTCYDTGSGKYEHSDCQSTGSVPVYINP